MLEIYFPYAKRGFRHMHRAIGSIYATPVSLPRNKHIIYAVRRGHLIQLVRLNAGRCVVLCSPCKFEWLEMKIDACVFLRLLR